MNGRNDRAGVGIKSHSGFRISDIPDDLAGDILYFNVSFGRDFTADESKAGGHERFACNARVRVLCQERIEDGVGNLIGNLVRMSLRDGLRSEQIPHRSDPVWWWSIFKFSTAAWGVFEGKTRPPAFSAGQAAEQSELTP